MDSRGFQEPEPVVPPRNDGIAAATTEVNKNTITTDHQGHLPCIHQK